MSQTLVVARRELSHLFHTPLAYVFLVVFVAVVTLPYVLVVFVQGQADLRLFFDTLPWCLVLFAAMVTMRAWAEERQENTYEMLLTFPMRERHLVLGKFLASFSFLLLGLACTLTLPAMLLKLGNPDVGAIASGYLGAALLAAMWCAGGIFISGLTRSQLLAAIVTTTLALCTLFLGTETFSGLLSARFAVIGALVETMTGAWSHYVSFEKGVVELADVAYFVVWTAAFLWLNALWVGMRRTPGSAQILAVGTPLALGCAMLVGRLSAGASWARLDLTEDKLYTLSDGTVAILGRARVPVRVTYYVSPQKDLPKEYEALERQVMDRLREIEIASGGKLVARVARVSSEALVKDVQEEFEEEIDPENPDRKAKEDEPKVTGIERRLLDKGQKPFPVASFSTTETSTRLIYSTLGIRYRHKDEEFLSQVIPERLGELEYQLASTVSRLVREKTPKIALYLGKEEMDPQLAQMYRQMGREPPVQDPYAPVADLLRREKYDAQRTTLTAHDPMPPDADALVVIGPMNLDERQRWEIDRALVQGVPAIVASQRYVWNYEVKQRSIAPVKTEIESGLDAILEKQGLGVSKDVLMDLNHVQLSFQMQTAQGAAILPVRVPTHVIVNETSMSRESAITQNLPSLLYVFGSPLSTDPARLSANGLEAATLFTSSERSWTVRPERVSFSVPHPSSFEPQPLALHVKGQFRSAFEGKPRPPYPFKMDDIMQGGRPRPAPPDPPETPATPRPGQMILVGCAQTFDRSFLAQPGDAAFLLNCIDALVSDEDLLRVRSKQPTDRRFDRPSDQTAQFWSLLILGGVPAAILAAGLLVWRNRIRRREQWVEAHGRES